jgi:nucleoside-diphosphate-sugar epimerase
MVKIALVLGGSGFIGSHLLKSLAESGEYARLVSVDIAEPRFATPGVEYKHADVTVPLPDDLCPGVTEIYNLAAVHTTPGHEEWEYYWTNVNGATHACDFARRNDVETIVFTSSIAVYGPSEALKDEDSALEPEIAYGKSKLCAERIHRLWQSEQSDRRKLVVVRPAVIYGYQERGNFTRLAKLLKRNRFAYPGRKDTIKACGYVMDLIASFKFMLAAPERTVTYNFAHPGRYTAEDICDAFAKAAGYQRPKIVFPISVMLLIGFGFEVLGKIGLKTSINRARVMKLNRSTNILPKRLMAANFPYKFDLEASLRDWRKMSPSGDFD